MNAMDYEKKYIDADRLRAEMEKRLKNVRDYMTGVGMKYKGPKYFKAQGKESAYDELLNVLDSLQREQPKRICHRCVYRNKTDDLCEYPYGGRDCLINENGVYECTGFCEKEQEKPSEDLEVRKQIEELANDWHHKGFASDEDCPLCMQDLMDILWHFYELGKNSK